MPHPKNQHTQITIKNQHTQITIKNQHTQITIKNQHTQITIKNQHTQITVRKAKNRKPKLTIFCTKSQFFNRIRQKEQI